MEVNTTDPGVQFYTGNFLDETEKGKGRAVYNKNAVFCLETEKYPVLNQPKTKKGFLFLNLFRQTRACYSGLTQQKKN